MKRLLIALFLPLFIACQPEEPEPTADFTYKLENEGRVQFSVSSANADTFAWDFGDGVTGEGKQAVHTYTANGNYIVTMKAAGKGGEVVKQQSISIANITGSVVFYISADPKSIIKVSIAGKAANITGYYSGSAPYCGDQYTATFTGLPEGTYNFTAEEIGKIAPIKWNGNIKVVGNQCSKMRLTW